MLLRVLVAQQESGPAESVRWLLRSARPTEKKEEREDEQNMRDEDCKLGEAEPGQGLANEQQAQQRQQQQLAPSAENTASGSGTDPVPPRARAAAADGGGNGRNAAASATGDAASSDRPVLVMQRAERYDTCGGGN